MTDNFAIGSLMPIDSRREEGDDVVPTQRMDFVVPGLMPVQCPRADTNVGEMEPALYKLVVSGGVLSFESYPLTFDVA